MACFHHSCFVQGVWRCLQIDVSVWGHATSFLRKGMWWDECAEKKDRLLWAETVGVGAMPYRQLWLL